MGLLLCSWVPVLRSREEGSQVQPHASASHTELAQAGSTQSCDRGSARPEDTGSEFSWAAEVRWKDPALGSLPGWTEGLGRRSPLWGIPPGATFNPLHREPIPSVLLPGFWDMAPCKVLSGMFQNHASFSSFYWLLSFLFRKS